MKRTVAILAMLLVSAIAPVTALAGTADQQAYAGSHVEFDTKSNAVVDYTVDGKQTVESMRVQSQSDAGSSVGLDGSADLDAAADIVGAALSLQAETDASASLTTESGASIEAHDNGRGSLVVTADESSQYVALNVSDDDTEQVSDQRVVYETEDGATATALVVGEGNVSVTDDGNLTAAVAEDSRLVVRSYTEGRTDGDETEERMIVNETAAASVYVMAQGEERVTDTVTYGQNTTVDVAQRTEGRVDMTVNRTAHEGRVVVTHVSDETFESADDVAVAVDGDAAASASSYTELRQAASGGETSKYMVEQSSAASADADATVLVGINHFSTRDVTMTDSDSDTSSSDTDTPSDDSDTSSDDSDTSSDDSESSNDDSSDDVGTSSGNGPGFGGAAVLLALISMTGLSVARRR